MDMDRAHAFIVQYEGDVPHFYLDVYGYVTIGIGCLVHPPDVVGLPMVVRATGAAADHAAILEDFARVGRAAHGLRASSYRHVTQCDLLPAGSRALFDQRVRATCVALNAIFPGFGEFPGGPQLGLLDIAFNCGIGSLKRDWPGLHKAVNARDWKLCALHSHRKANNDADHALHDRRNAETEALFLSAA